MGVKDNRYEYKKIAPDGGYGWVVLFACFVSTHLELALIWSVVRGCWLFVCHYLQDGQLYCRRVNVLNRFDLATHKKQLRCSSGHGQLGERSLHRFLVLQRWVWTPIAGNRTPSLNNLIHAFEGPIVSGLSTQFGIRPVVIGGAIITSTCMVATAFAPSIYFILVIYGVIGGIHHLSHSSFAAFKLPVD